MFLESELIEKQKFERKLPLTSLEELELSDYLNYGQVWNDAWIFQNFERRGET